MSVKGNLYRHFKGGIYRLLHPCLDSETREARVVYQAEAGGQVWIRLKSDWEKLVEWPDGKMRPRFTNIVDLDAEEQPEIGLLVQAIIMRGGLGMGLGAQIVQGAHASMRVFLDRGDHGYIHEAHNHLQFTHEAEEGDPGLLIDMTPDMVTWAEGKQAKVCYQVASEEGLLALYDQAMLEGLPCALIQTLVGGNKTFAFPGLPIYTCIAVGPGPAQAIDRITEGLKLL